MLNSKAYTEVFCIINLMTDEMKTKIPEKIMKNIQERMDINYEFYIYEEDIEDAELLEDTEKILSVLYTDYLSTDEERKIILNKERILLNSKNNTENKTVEIKDVFSKNKISEQDDIASNTKELINAKKENWYSKIFNFIKRIFY